MNDMENEKPEENHGIEETELESQEEVPEDVLGFEIHEKNPSESLDDEDPPIDDTPSGEPEDEEEVAEEVLGFEIGGEAETGSNIPPIQEDTGEAVSLQIEVIQHKIDLLNQEIITRLDREADKDKIIDSLHKELQGYKSDSANKQFLSLVIDIVKIIDDIRKLSNHHRSNNPEESDPVKVLELLESIPADLEDIFSYQGITPYTCDGTVFDPVRQKVLKKIETDDNSLDKTVAESLRPGYEWENKIIRSEIVNVYVFSPTGADSKADDSDE